MKVTCFIVMDLQRVKGGGIVKRAGGSKLSGTGERPITPLRLYSFHPGAPRTGGLVVPVSRVGDDRSAETRRDAAASPVSSAS